MKNILFLFRDMNYIPTLRALNNIEFEKKLMDHLTVNFIDVYNTTFTIRNSDFSDFDLIVLPSPCFYIDIPYRNKVIFIDAEIFSTLRMKNIEQVVRLLKKSLTILQK